MTDGEDTKTIGSVEEVLPNSLFRVRVLAPAGAEDAESESAPEEAVKEDTNEAKEKEEHVVLAYLAGKMRLHHIRVLVGDQVEMVLDPYGGRARIVRRLT